VYELRRNRSNSGYTLVFEAIIFATLIIISFLIFYRVAPPTTTVSSENTISDLKTLGDDILRYLYDKPVEGAPSQGYPDNTLAYHFINNNSEALRENISLLLPATVEYNVYFGNGTQTFFWFSSHGNDYIEPIGATARAHVVIPADYQLIIDKWGNDGAISNYTGSIYEIIMELWYI